MNELENIDNINIDDLYNRIVTLIENAKRNVATTVNQEMTLLYWNIGKDITDNVLKNNKAEYGLDKFRPEYKGQVELYLKWLDKYEKTEGEESPIAIILCATKSDMMAQLLELDNSGIHVAQYLTEYVPKEILEQKLINSIENAKIQLEQRKNIEDNNK